MSLHEYDESKHVGAKDYPFYALIMAAMRQADISNLYKLRRLFPSTWIELQDRYNAPGGILPGETLQEGDKDVIQGTEDLAEPA